MNYSKADGKLSVVALLTVAALLVLGGLLSGCGITPAATVDEAGNKEGSVDYPRVIAKDVNIDTAYITDWNGTGKTVVCMGRKLDSGGKRAWGTCDFTAVDGGPDLTIPKGAQHLKPVEDFSYFKSAFTGKPAVCIGYKYLDSGRGWGACHFEK